MVDLAVPRDIDPAVADLEDVYLFSIDDLQQLVDENRQSREVAAGGARLLIGEEVARFLAESRGSRRGARHPYSLRRQADDIRQQTARASATHAGGGQIRRRSARISWPIPSPIACCTPRRRRCARHPNSADLGLAEAVTRLLTEERDRQ